MESALGIASHFIEKSFQEDIRLTNMQLQKMVYIANGFYLALKEKPLVNENVEAWSYGPVIRPLYDSLRVFGSGRITNNLLSLYSSPVNLSDSDIKAVLEFTWKACKDKDGIQLSNWSHKEDSPWTKAVQEQKPIIPNEYMIDYFKKFLKKK
ncbi:Uncharacterized phage-associated protein [Pedobacter sp. ok626]|uniref:Panacea domain-containing protein n=1 Tax=Pedobacter sp. ok626 TaxID=1761882 RepID=UPI00088D7AF3|nr:type II toxin-antitoxin system antitoxin SocA domain-containing protein [Pedobacter sp. ok626]SDJ95760.1 Uncharacterized phage-associated protein [Pedobacter sp. ok626]